MKNLKHILIFIFIFFLFGCSSRNELKQDDYEIINLLIKENVFPTLDQFDNDSAFSKLDKNSKEFIKRRAENLRLRKI